jgi:type IV pilus assembly protein PilC
VSSGVPILEALHITRETAGNAVFEKLYKSVYDSIREGESIAQPLKDNANPGIHPGTVFFIWFFVGAPVGAIAGAAYGGYMGASMWFAVPAGTLIVGIGISMGIFFLKMNKPVIDDMVVNMVDVGEETGELDTMLYKVADTYDEEVAVLTDGLTKLMEPLLIIFLGGAVGFIVVALFVPLVKLIEGLS